MKKYPTARFSFLLHTIIAIFLFLVFYAIANYVGDNFNNSVEARNIEAILNIANLFFIFYFFYSMKNLVAYKKYIIRFKKSKRIIMRQKQKEIVKIISLKKKKKKWMKWVKRQLIHYVKSNNIR